MSSSKVVIKIDSCSNPNLNEILQLACGNLTGYFYSMIGVDEVVIKGNEVYYISHIQGKDVINKYIYQDGKLNPDNGNSMKSAEIVIKIDSYNNPNSDEIMRLACDKIAGQFNSFGSLSEVVIKGNEVSYNSYTQNDTFITKYKYKDGKLEYTR